MRDSLDEREARRWLRHLQCELPADETLELERRLAEDAELAARYGRFAETWNRLEGPPAEAVPADFAPRVAAAARDLGRGSRELSWGLAPAWARAGSLAALLAGLLLGVTIGGEAGPAEIAGSEAEIYAWSEPLSLAESFWLALDEGEGGLGNADAGGGRVQ